jgi:hypothetical protein
MNIYLIPGLALVTMAIVGFVALRSKRDTEERRHSDSMPKSALAKDGDPHRKAP